MATSLAQQLQQIREQRGLIAPRQFTKKKLEPSILYDPAQAAAVDTSLICERALAAFQVLRAQEPAFEVADRLFHPSYVEVDRAFLSAEENASIDAKTECFFYAAGPYFLSPEVASCIEYLLRRFQVHSFAFDQMLGAFLAFHETPRFVRVVQTLVIPESSPWVWLSKVREQGVPIKRSLLVQLCIRNPFFTQFFQNAFMRLFATVLSGESSPPLQRHPMIRFYGLLMSEVVRETPKFNDSLMQILLPGMVSGLDRPQCPHAFAAGLALASHICCVASLTENVASSLCDLIVASMADHDRDRPGHLTALTQTFLTAALIVSRQKALRNLSAEALRTLCKRPRRGGGGKGNFLLLDVMEELRARENVDVSPFLSVFLSSALKLLAESTEEDARGDENFLRGAAAAETTEGQREKKLRFSSTEVSLGHSCVSLFCSVFEKEREVAESPGKGKRVLAGNALEAFAMAAFQAFHSACRASAAAGSKKPGPPLLLTSIEAVLQKVNEADGRAIPSTLKRLVELQEAEGGGSIGPLVQFLSGTLEGTPGEILKPSSSSSSKEKGKGKEAIPVTVLEGLLSPTKKIRSEAVRQAISQVEAAASKDDGDGDQEASSSSSSSSTLLRSLLSERVTDSSTSIAEKVLSCDALWRQESASRSVPLLLGKLRQLLEEIGDPLSTSQASLVMEGGEEGEEVDAGERAVSASGVFLERLCAGPLSRKLMPPLLRALLVAGLPDTERQSTGGTSVMEEAEGALGAVSLAVALSLSLEAVARGETHEGEADGGDEEKLVLWAVVMDVLRVSKLPLLSRLSAKVGKVKKSAGKPGGSFLRHFRSALAAAGKEMGKGGEGKDGSVSVLPECSSFPVVEVALRLSVVETLSHCSEGEESEEEGGELAQLVADWGGLLEFSLSLLTSLWTQGLKVLSNHKAEKKKRKVQPGSQVVPLPTAIPHLQKVAGSLAEGLIQLVLQQGGGVSEWLEAEHSLVQGPLHCLYTSVVWMLTDPPVFTSALSHFSETVSGDAKLALLMAIAVDLGLPFLDGGMDRTGARSGRKGTRRGDLFEKFLPFASLISTNALCLLCAIAEQSAEVLGTLLCSPDLLVVLLCLLRWGHEEVRSQALSLCRAAEEGAGEGERDPEGAEKWAVLLGLSKAMGVEGDASVFLWEGGREGERKVAKSLLKRVWESAVGDWGEAVLGDGRQTMEILKLRGGVEGGDSGASPETRKSKKAKGDKNKTPSVSLGALVTAAGCRAEPILQAALVEGGLSGILPLPLLAAICRQALRGRVGELTRELLESPVDGGLPPAPILSDLVSRLVAVEGRASWDAHPESKRVPSFLLEECLSPLLDAAATASRAGGGGAFSASLRDEAELVVSLVSSPCVVGGMDEDGQVTVLKKLILGGAEASAVLGPAPLTCARSLLLPLKSLFAFAKDVFGEMGKKKEKKKVEAVTKERQALCAETLHALLLLREGASGEEEGKEAEAGGAVEGLLELLCGKVRDMAGGGGAGDEAVGSSGVASPQGEKGGGEGDADESSEQRCAGALTSAVALLAPESEKGAKSLSTVANGLASSPSLLSSRTASALLRGAAGLVRSGKVFLKNVVEEEEEDEETEEEAEASPETEELKEALRNALGAFARGHPLSVRSPFFLSALSAHAPILVSPAQSIKESEDAEEEDEESTRTAVILDAQHVLRLLVSPLCAAAFLTQTGEAALRLISSLSALSASLRTGWRGAAVCVSCLSAEWVSWRVGAERGGAVPRLLDEISRVDALGGVRARQKEQERLRSRRDALKHLAAVAEEGDDLWVSQAQAVEGCLDLLTPLEPIERVEACGDLASSALRSLSACSAAVSRLFGEAGIQDVEGDGQEGEDADSCRASVLCSSILLLVIARTLEKGGTPSLDELAESEEPIEGSEGVVGGGDKEGVEERRAGRAVVLLARGLLELLAAVEKAEKKTDSSRGEGEPEGESELGELRALFSGLRVHTADLLRLIFTAMAPVLGVVKVGLCCLQLPTSPHAAEELLKKAQKSKGKGKKAEGLEAVPPKQRRAEIRLLPRLFSFLRPTVEGMGSSEGEGGAQKGGRKRAHENAAAGAAALTSEGKKLSTAVTRRAVPLYSLLLTALSVRFLESEEAGSGKGEGAEANGKVVVVPSQVKVEVWVFVGVLARALGRSLPGPFQSAGMLPQAAGALPALLSGGVGALKEGAAMGTAVLSCTASLLGSLPSSISLPEVNKVAAALGETSEALFGGGGDGEGEDEEMGEGEEEEEEDDEEMYRSLAPGVAKRLRSVLKDLDLQRLVLGLLSSLLALTRVHGRVLSPHLKTLTLSLFARSSAHAAFAAALRRQEGTGALRALCQSGGSDEAIQRAGMRGDPLLAASVLFVRCLRSLLEKVSLRSSLGVVSQIAHESGGSATVTTSSEPAEGENRAERAARLFRLGRVEDLLAVAIGETKTESTGTSAGLNSSRPALIKLTLWLATLPGSAVSKFVSSCGKLGMAPESVPVAAAVCAAVLGGSFETVHSAEWEGSGRGGTLVARLEGEETGDDALVSALVREPRLLCGMGEVEGPLMGLLTAFALKATQADLSPFIKQLQKWARGRRKQLLGDLRGEFRKERRTAVDEEGEQDEEALELHRDAANARVFTLLLKGLSEELGEFLLQDLLPSLLPDLASCLEAVRRQAGVLARGAAVLAESGDGGEEDDSERYRRKKKKKKLLDIAEEDEDEEDEEGSVRKKKKAALSAAAVEADKVLADGSSRMEISRKLFRQIKPVIPPGAPRPTVPLWWWFECGIPTLQLCSVCFSKTTGKTPESTLDTLLPPLIASFDVLAVLPARIPPPPSEAAASAAGGSGQTSAPGSGGSAAEDGVSAAQVWRRNVEAAVCELVASFVDRETTEGGGAQTGPRAWVRRAMQALLGKTRHSSPAVREAAVASLCACWKRSGLGLAATLNESTVHLSELLEDSDDAVEAAARRWLRLLEQLTGENLSQMLKR
uniref:HEAT repeat-containing protein 1 n=1 Tax=Chromera velia CCMP2878 TaxID=1169474 RepID=A0A0G4I2I8_9ALVE|eukprot:Cvel_10340.t1-p1 / transcript=Cvel_10340.t1 / gene=Cvel_10340 / organism=Chromera_velia_CCMP2878 / gene_product=HEAT repeat-containing protein 1 homolog, putative / transcript_product=HEAT repeat-containing protein 1 homolog, putative / location=Cvel_scaffold621:20739-35964(+) / protein_length=2970 / sequence_SO=supercontig / SO=protein_coding / is_pseudo=false